jgi:molybdopterin-guanine dinucleotide biosynthesis protein B
MESNSQKVIAICGVKNSGKTRLIEALLPILEAMGHKVAVIKHHGHKLDPDVPGTDTYRFSHNGAYATVITDDECYMLVKNLPSNTDEMIALFPEADIILLEGYKNSPYPKIELRRESAEPVATDQSTVIAIIRDEDIPPSSRCVPIFSSNDFNSVAEFITKTYVIPA